MKAVEEDDVDRVGVYAPRTRGVKHATTNSLTFCIAWSLFVFPPRFKEYLVTCF